MLDTRWNGLPLLLPESASDMQFNGELSQMISEGVEARRRQCYWNALDSQQNVKAMEGALYVEGFVAHSNGGWYEHGWLEHDGKIVDPTLVIPPRKQKDREIEEWVVYFPAIHYTYEEAFNLTETIGIERMPFAMQRDPVPTAWKVVREDVITFCQGLRGRVIDSSLSCARKVRPLPLPEGPFMWVREASERLKLHERTTRRLIKKGDLPSIRLGRRILVRRDAVEDMANRLLAA